MCIRDSGHPARVWRRTRNPSRTHSLVNNSGYRDRQLHQRISKTNPSGSLGLRSGWGWSGHHPCRARGISVWNRYRPCETCWIQSPGYPFQNWHVLIGLGIWKKTPGQVRVQIETGSGQTTGSLLTINLFNRNSRVIVFKSLSDWILPRNISF